MKFSECRNVLQKVESQNTFHAALGRQAVAGDLHIQHVLIQANNRWDRNERHVFEAARGDDRDALSGLRGIASNRERDLGKHNRGHRSGVNNVQLNREIYINSGAKPGYSKYTYPHPARAALGTPAPSDTTAPSVPAGLTATAVSASQINLSWTASSDNVGVTGYKIFRCAGSSCTPATEIATVTGTTYVNTGLTASTTDRYAVSAVDAAGNMSAASAPAGAITGSGSYACDLNGSGTPDVADVQLTVNQVLAPSACLPAGQAGSGDIIRDGRCDVVDVQRVVTAALGGVCASSKRKMNYQSQKGNHNG